MKPIRKEEMILNVDYDHSSPHDVLMAIHRCPTYVYVGPIFFGQHHYRITLVTFRGLVGAQKVLKYCASKKLVPLTAQDALAFRKEYPNFDGRGRIVFLGSTFRVMHYREKSREFSSEFVVYLDRDGLVLNAVRTGIDWDYRGGAFENCRFAVMPEETWSDMTQGWQEAELPKH